MKINSIQWRNIGSFGNKIQTLNFSNNGEVWQLYGRVGHGKSTILSLPTLAFYGKIKDTKVGDIANRINKNGWIKIDVQVNNDNYIIERGFSPSSLSISKNGQLLDRAKDMQKIIDEEIVGLPYYIFTNILSLSLNNFKSFINMTPNDKRQIIDKIFSLEIINKIYEFIKHDLKDLGQSINSIEMQIYSFEQTIKQSNVELDKILNAKTDIDIDEQIANNEKILLDIDTNINNHLTSYNEYNQKIIETETKVNQLQQYINTIYNDINNINQKINLFNQHKCPLCNSDFDTDEFNDIRVTLKTQLNEKTTLYNTYNESLNQFRTFLTQLKTNIQTINNNITTLRVNKNNVINNINNIKNSINNTTQIDAINNIIKSAENSKDLLNTNKREYETKINYLQILDSIYNADGIKKSIMDNYIPTLNDEIKHALINLSFPYSLEFDNNFSVHLEYLGDEIPVTSLSTGESKKADLAVLISMIKIIKTKYPQINLICLDETISSIDPESCIDIIKLLREISIDLFINILIVSHVQLPVEYFDKRIDVFKDGGFSDINFMD